MLLIGGEIIPGRSYNASTEDEKYKFTEKERDIETDYDYFGARYYNSKLGLWNSVDPLADKYPGWSPYNYTLGNPLKFVDPNGEYAKIPIGGRYYITSISHFEAASFHFGGGVAGIIPGGDIWLRSYAGDNLWGSRYSQAQGVMRGAVISKASGIVGGIYSSANILLEWANISY